MDEQVNFPNFLETGGETKKESGSGEMLLVRIPPNLAQTVRKIAMIEERTYVSVISRALKSYFQKNYPNGFENIHDIK